LADTALPSKEEERRRALPLLVGEQSEAFTDLTEMGWSCLGGGCGRSLCLKFWGTSKFALVRAGISHKPLTESRRSLLSNPFIIQGAFIATGTSTYIFLLFVSLPGLLAPDPPSFHPQIGSDVHGQLRITSVDDYFHVPGAAMEKWGAHHSLGLPIFAESINFSPPS
jgi:hypothetical protein